MPYILIEYPLLIHYLKNNRLWNTDNAPHERPAFRRNHARTRDRKDVSSTLCARAAIGFRLPWIIQDTTQPMWMLIWKGLRQGVWYFRCERTCATCWTPTVIFIMLAILGLGLTGVGPTGRYIRTIIGNICHYSNYGYIKGTISYLILLLY